MSSDSLPEECSIVDNVTLVTTRIGTSFSREESSKDHPVITWVLTSQNEFRIAGSTDGEAILAPFDRIDALADTSEAIWLFCAATAKAGIDLTERQLSDHCVNIASAGLRYSDGPATFVTTLPREEVENFRRSIGRSRHCIVISQRERATIDESELYRGSPYVKDLTIQTSDVLPDRYDQATAEALTTLVARLSSSPTFLAESEAQQEVALPEHQRLQAFVAAEELKKAMQERVSTASE